MFLSALVAESSISNMLQFGEIEDLFKASEVDAYQFVREFVKQYGKLPTPATIEAHTGETLVPHSEPSAYYVDLMQARHIELTLKKGMKQASDLLLPENKDPDEALKSVTETCMQLISRKHAKQVLDFRHAYDLVTGDYASKWNGVDEKGLLCGWPTLDKATGGLVKGDVLSMCGRPGAGKTWQMLYAAHFGWNKAGMEQLQNPDDETPDQSRMFVSMEMTVLAIAQRLAAMQAHVSSTKLKHAALGTTSKLKMKEALTVIQGFGAPFYVVDGNLAATVEDIWMLARQLKPAAIFIDGGYLVKHPSERDRFRRVAENSNLIKQNLAPIAPTAVSWQFAKTAAKKDKKKGEKVGLEDIGYTDAIAQDSSVVCGIFEDESIETEKHRVIDLLKGRSGETGRFKTRWDFEHMHFEEVEEQDVEDLQFS
jgi:replicative DNA helicase